MPRPLGVPSLRARLAALAAVTVAALLVAMFVAWRLARATETFAARRAEASAREAVLDLARERRLHPDGYATESDAAPPAPRHGPHRPALPPPVAEAFAGSDDPLSRLTAVTLHRFPSTTGGFFRVSDGAFVGTASPELAGTGLGAALPAGAEAAVRACLSDASAGGPDVVTRVVPSGSDSLTVAVFAPRDGDVAWAATRVSRAAGVADGVNAAALAALALALVAVSGLAFATVRDMRRGVKTIEDGLAGLGADLDRRIDVPRTPELARIARAVNDLAGTLRTNLERQRRLEAELRQSERLTALGRLVAGVAHEVRNPLSAIKLKLQMARRRETDAEALDRTFRVVVEEVDRLDGLVRRLLELGREPRPRRPLDLRQLVASRAALAADVAASRGVRVSTTEAPEPVRVDGDDEGLAQVLDNLLANAVESMPEGGEVTVSCALGEGGVARVVVDDEGVGIAPEDRERVFDPFFTGRATGTGLGLAIAREIVEAHGGRIRFEGRMSGGTRCAGTRCVVEFPALPPDAGHGAE